MNFTEEIKTKIFEIEDIISHLYCGNPHKWELRDRIIAMFEEMPELNQFYEVDWHQNLWAERIKRRPRIVEPLPIEMNWPVAQKDVCPACYDYSEKFTGLYFMGATYFDPIKNIPYFMVKIGATYTSTIAARLRAYTTHNPMIYHKKASLAYSLCPEASEEKCHQFLRRHSYQVPERGEEWFMVDRETYLELCERFQNPLFFADVATGKV